MNKAIIDNDVLGTKAKQEKNFAEFAKGKTEYEGVVERIDEIIAKRMPLPVSSTTCTNLERRHRIRKPVHDYA